MWTGRDDELPIVVVEKCGRVTTRDWGFSHASGGRVDNPTSEQSGSRKAKGGLHWKCIIQARIEAAEHSEFRHGKHCIQSILSEGWPLLDNQRFYLQTAIKRI